MESNLSSIPYRIVSSKKVHLIYIHSIRKISLGAVNCIYILKHL